MQVVTDHERHDRVVVILIGMVVAGDANFGAGQPSVPAVISARSPFRRVLRSCGGRRPSSRWQQGPKACAALALRPRTRRSVELWTMVADRCRLVSPPPRVSSPDPARPWLPSSTRPRPRRGGIAHRARSRGAAARQAQRPRRPDPGSWTSGCERLAIAIERIAQPICVG